MVKKKELNYADIEKYISRFPIYQYAFLKPDEVEYTEKVRQMCKRNCSHYATSWSCPPAIGRIDRCRNTCLKYDAVLVFSTVTELKGDTAIEAEEAQKEHERLTGIICSRMLKKGYITYAITSSWCKKCKKCTFPKDYCPYLDDMYPCIESHGIIVSDLMGKCGMDYYLGGKFCLLFSLVYFKDTDISDKQRV